MCIDNKNEIRSVLKCSLCVASQQETNTVMDSGDD